MSDIITILALVLLIGLSYASYKTISYTQRNLRSLIKSRSVLVLTRVALIVIGAIAGFLLTSISWRVSSTHVVVGLPIPWAIWESVNGHWEDFVSPLSVVPWAIDVAFGLPLSHLPVAAVFVIRKLRRVTREPEALPKSGS